MKNIVGVNRGHNASVALIEDGDIVFHLENERLTNIKYDWYAFGALSQLPNYVNKVDGIAVAGLTKTVPVDTYAKQDLYTTFIRNLKKSFHKDDVMVSDMGHIHHQLHASTAFYNSGFDEALCIIRDGMGSEFYFNDSRFNVGSYGRESHSTFVARYPSSFELIDKSIIVAQELDVDYNQNTRVTGNCSEAFAFDIASKFFGWHGLEAGKVMGMSSYGKYDSNIPSIYNEDKINRDLFSFGEDLNNGYVNTAKYSYLTSQEFRVKANFAYALQKATQEHISNYINRMIEKTGIKNVCLSGGYFLNCVANYHILKNLPKDVNLYVEPISSDAGTSLGAAKLLWHLITKDTTKRKLSSLYLGPTHEYDINYIKNNLANEETLHEGVTAKEVASLIANKNLVAMYQGRSESGPRALGNRSFLYDPRDPEGKDEVNKIKKREWFRPFAGTVLYEHRNEWFDLHTMNESAFMMYAVNVKKDSVPAITHVDNTCRVQTLKQSQNENFYDLIDEFYKQTGVPILLNTSLNLAGDCIAETIDDALNIIRNSSVKYLYLPELKCLISK